MQIYEGTDVVAFESYDKYSLKNDRRRLYTLADAFWAWCNGEVFPIGFIGDSTTDGAGTTHGATHETEDTAAGGWGLVDYINPDAYPYILQEKLRDYTGNSNLRVYNIGYSGTYFDWAIPKYDDIFGHVYSDVKMVGLVYGINDRTRYSTSEEYYQMFRGNLEYTINYLYDKGIQPFLVTCQGTFEPYTSTLFPTLFMRTSSYINAIANNVMRDVAKEYNLEILDMSEFDNLLFTKSEYSMTQLIPDTLHFSDLGNELEGGYLFSQINPNNIDITEACKIGLSNQNVISMVNSNYVTGSRVNGFNGYVNYNRAGDSSDILLEGICINNQYKKVTLKAHCTNVDAQYVVVDGVSTAITATEQTITTLDIGQHFIIARSGSSELLNWLGFSFE